MDHVAILKKSLGLLPKIISGEKSVESRWYVSRFAPWDKVAAGDTVYFKNAGEDVFVKAIVGKVLQFENLTEEKIRNILAEYGERIGIERSKWSSWIAPLAKTKHYCILIFLNDPQEIKPFKINKTGFGNSCAWLCVGKIENVVERFITR